MMVCGLDHSSSQPFNCMALLYHVSNHIKFSGDDLHYVTFPDGVPNDGIPIEDVVTVSLDLTVVYVILAIAGMVFAVACLAFTLIFRERRYMCTLCVWVL